MADLSDYFGDIDVSAGFGGQGYGTDAGEPRDSLDSDWVQQIAKMPPSASINLKNQELVSKGVKGGLEEYNTYGPQLQAFVDSKQPGTDLPFWARNVEEEFAGHRSAFMSELINRGVTDDKDLDDATAHAASIGAFNTAQPFQTFIDDVNTQLSGIDYSTPQAGNDFQRYGPSLLDLLFNRDGARDSATMNDLVAAAVPSVISGPLGTPMTLGNLALGAATGLSPYGNVNRYGLNFDINRNTGEGGGFRSEFQDLPVNVDYGNDPSDFTVGPSAIDPSMAGWDRSAALDALIQGTLAGTTNPGIADNYFNNIIKGGILRRNTALGPDATQQQFESEFGSGRLGEELLGEESGRLREDYAGQVGNLFTGKAFEPITDDTAISNILGEQRSSALGDIARFGARGNLSPTGGATAGQYITRKEPEARSRLEAIGESVRGSAQRDIDVIRDRALQETGAFNLGDPFFDIAPYASERESMIQGRLPRLEGDIRTQLGTEQLFDPTAAITEAATTQGLVSGAPSFLDELAGRDRRRSLLDRGQSSLGSGRF